MPRFVFVSGDRFVVEAPDFDSAERGVYDYMAGSDVNYDVIVHEDGTDTILVEGDEYA